MAEAANEAAMGGDPSLSPRPRLSPVAVRPWTTSPPPTTSSPCRSPGSAARGLRQRAEPFFIGVAGGTASGKSTVCDLIVQSLHDQCVALISQDSFYRGLTPEEHEHAADYDFDRPEALDVPAILECLRGLRAHRAVDVPVYDFVRHQRAERTHRVAPADVVVLEGILVLHVPEVRDMLNMKIFVDTDDDVRLARRIQRDVAERGRDVAGVIHQYTRFVKPSFDRYVAPSRRHADVIIPWHGGTNGVAINLIAQHIRHKLQQHDLRRVYRNLEIMPSNFQIRGMHTIIRDRNTSKADFVFYADRLFRLLVEASLGHLPFAGREVQTPAGCLYEGVSFARRLCGVSIIRSGEAMENALRACCKGIKIGKILVHRTGDRLVDEEIVYEKLPSDVASRHVLVMDPVLGTGATADRAVRVLLDRGVPEGNVLFLTLVAAPEGIHRICSKYPQVKLITTEIDERVENFRVVPGLGEFGDRYFGD